MKRETPDRLLRRAKSLLRAGKRRKAALTAKKVIEAHDFTNERAWRLLHDLTGAERPFDEWRLYIARKYYPERARLIDTQVATVVADWLETPGATRQDLEERLRPHFNDNQDLVETVAVTEVTRAVARRDYQEYAKAGVVLPPLFDSGRGTPARFGPPWHSGCRCWTRVIRLPDNTWVVVWSTNRDELVCRTPIKTPWGEVEGCRALHNVVLSAGPYLGKSLAEARRLARADDTL